MHETTRAAIAALGPASGDDWKLDPKVHVARMTPDATALARVLHTREVETAGRLFEAEDKAATSHQKHFRLLGSSANRARFLAILLGSIFVLPFAAKADPKLAMAFLFLQFLALFVALAAPIWLAWRKPAERWRAARSNAEYARIGLFEAALAPAGETGAGDLPLLPLQLEYFRRYQLDVQRQYFRAKEQQVVKAGNRTRAAMTVYWALLLGAGIAAAYNAAALFNYVKGLDDNMRPIFLALGTVASGLFSAIAAHALMNLDHRTPRPYKLMADFLDKQAGAPLQRARDAAVLGDRKPMLELVKSVHDEISAEHRAWKTLGEMAATADGGDVAPVPATQS
jgi:hypothetical protein